MDSLLAFTRQQLHHVTADTEIEFRFGTFTPQFQPGISENLFNKLITSSQPQEIIEYIYPSYNIRTRDNLVITKTNKKVYDARMFGIRFSSCNEVFSELPLQFCPSKRLKRTKTRYSKQISECFRLDLTRIRFKGVISFEMELELTSASFTNSDFFYAFSIVYPRAFYHDLVKSPRFIGNQPKTLEIKDLQSLSGRYLVTDKADGLRKLLLYTKFGNYLIGGNLSCELFQDSIIIPEFSGTLLDGEYINGQFYAFDTLFFKGHNLIQEFLQVRLHTLSKIPGIVIKTFTKNISDIETLSCNYDRDGLILTPISAGYNNDTFKYKQEITIDLLYWYGRLYAQKGHTIKTVVDYPFECPPEFNGQIVEFLITTDKLLFVKARKDKERPNAILTVESAFKAFRENIKINEINL